MLNIPTKTVARMIDMARDGAQDRLRDTIAGLDADARTDLVALAWIGRDSFVAEELDEARSAARQAPTAEAQDYLSREPRLPDFLEAGMEALGLRP